MADISSESFNPPELDLSGLPAGTELKESTVRHHGGNLLKLQFNFPVQYGEKLPYEFSTGVTRDFLNRGIEVYLAFLNRTHDQTSVEIYGINPEQKQDVIDAVREDIVPTLFPESC